MALEFSHCPKEDILECVLKYYHPDKTTIELGDLFHFFGIQSSDILEAHNKFVNQEKPGESRIMGTLRESIEWMKNGHKVRSDRYVDGDYFFVDNDDIKFYSDGTTSEATFCVEDFEAHDWEAIKEVKTLSDEQFEWGQWRYSAIPTPKVKRFVNRLLELTKNDGIHECSVYYEIKKLAGDALCTGGEE